MYADILFSTPPELSYQQLSSQDVDITPLDSCAPGQTLYRNTVTNRSASNVNITSVITSGENCPPNQASIETGGIANW